MRVCGWSLGPARWREGVSKHRGGALGGGVGVGLGVCVAEGRLRGQRIRPRSPIGSLVPKWTGKELAVFPSVSRPPPTPAKGLPQGSPPGSPPLQARPLTVGGCRWV